jgi:hypothetical protein
MRPPACLSASWRHARPSQKKPFCVISCRPEQPWPRSVSKGRSSSSTAGKACAVCTVGVHLRAVDATRNHDERRLEGIHLRDDDGVERRTVHGVAAGQVERHVDVVADARPHAHLLHAARFRVSSALLPRALVHVQRHAQHVAPVVEEALRAVAVMRVEIHDRDAVPLRCGPLRRDSRIVAKAVAVAARARRVVARWADQRVCNRTCPCASGNVAHTQFNAMPPARQVLPGRGSDRCWRG